MTRSGRSSDAAGGANGPDFAQASGCRGGASSDPRAGVATPVARQNGPPAEIANGERQTPCVGAATPFSVKRGETFDRLSRMFRRAGTDVTAQALFRAIVEYRDEALEKSK